MGTPEQASRAAMAVDGHIGRLIRKRRVALGLTQDDLAVRLKISYQQVQKYETGANRVSAARLFEIAGALEIPVAYFFDGLDPAMEAPGLAHGGRDRATIELVRNFLSIEKPEVREAVSSLLRALTDTPDEAQPSSEASLAFPSNGRQSVALRGAEAARPRASKTSSASKT